MIDDRWSRDAEELGAALRRVLAKHSGSDQVRAAEAGDGTDRALDAALTEFGLGDLAGQPELLVRAAREVGAALAPTPFVASVPALALLGRGDVSDGVDRPLAAAGVDLVAVRTGATVGLVSPGAAVRTAAGESAHDVRALGGTPAPTDAEARTWISWGWLATAAALVGAAENLLTRTVEYVSQRHQFGRPVGAFQGVAFPLADAATAVRGADLLVRKTTYLAANDGEPPRHFAAMTAYAARRAARQTASTTHQAMGGQGFTTEADTQLYSRRLRTWSAAMPDPASALADLARTLADPEAREQVTDLWQFDRGFELPRWVREADAASRGAAR
ncbi:hypothetical protein EFK50_11260 [Nocardioides marmoriginsengisoli]|uniref:Acyl-CoA dehydrogenase/oxidase C-terminal domain-containing protein n=1 Tax=Nocardioides marmoriginsengisoli TaxID=661483 RepID=A0A3N0CGB5_9ACTN|nr:acyl-CoA dehydrogenase family protein [Nocardioides marmoriginsengisoli]RNL62349.1 hypothetical protein EFK50_11260 [Nocardioides marmoriginsengisoli]